MIAARHTATEMTTAELKRALDTLEVRLKGGLTTPGAALAQAALAGMAWQKLALVEALEAAGGEIVTAADLRKAFSLTSRPRDARLHFDR